jgi:hypothetical protein
MPITINGTGSIAGLSAGGLPDGCVTAPDLDGAQTGAAPIYAARAWVNFNGTGVVAIRASGNVSSITDNGVGDYTVNFTTAMPDANYVPAISAGVTAALGYPSPYLSTLAAGTLRFVTGTNVSSPSDNSLVAVSVFR